MRTFIVCQYEELMSKGNFAREDAVTMLTAHEGNVDAAFQVQLCQPLKLALPSVAWIFPGKRKPALTFFEM
jgi:hypothetical protein